ncbi:MAG: hypothetical protein HC780_04555 [Leptolyngbyaceae cyanobacterium CSU_1_3]|nr:hypothetical protein [Leptolyngbyaceae cyanobacterium CSU_1_3]
MSAEYDQPDLETHSLVKFKDGRVFERYSKPHYIDQKIVGRVISCLNITADKQAEAAIATPKRDLIERKRLASKLAQAREELEIRVALQTATLRQTNAQLRQEIAERQKTETALRDSQQLLRAIIDNSPSIIYLTDREENFFADQQAV